MVREGRWVRWEVNVGKGSTNVRMGDDLIDGDVEKLKMEEWGKIRLVDR